jgi:hypothetical protein
VRSFCCSDTQGVLAPWLDVEFVVVEAETEGVVLGVEHVGRKQKIVELERRSCGKSEC